MNYKYSENAGYVIGNLTQHGDYSAGKIDTLIGQRLKFLKDTILDIMTDIQKREDIFMKNMTELDSKECHLGSIVQFLDTKEPMFGKARTSMEISLMDVLEHRTSNRVSHWQDIVSLKRDLRTVLEDYYLTCAAFDIDPRKWQHRTSSGS